MELDPLHYGKSKMFFLILLGFFFLFLFLLCLLECVSTQEFGKEEQHFLSWLKSPAVLIQSHYH